MSHPKIAIIGAGPAGCTLALILHKAGIPTIIFEGEPSANSRHQGGTLDLHEDTGLAAIKRAGLYEQFTKFARYDGEAIKIANKHMRLFINMGGATQASTRGRPEIDRAQLRQLLVSALPTDTIRWNHRLRSVDHADPSNITLNFDNGTRVSDIDLLIGADGAWSKIRPLLTSMRPFYAGVHMTRYTIPSAASTQPSLDRLVNRGSLFAFSDGQGLTAQQMSDGALTVSAIRVAPESYASSHADVHASTAASKAHAQTDFASWAPELRAFFAAADDAETPWSANIYSLPPGVRWAHRRAVTLVGDAAHVMVPFAGEGVNVSMTDSVRLADAIIASVGKGAHVLDEKVRAFEEEMFVRAGRVAQTSWTLMQAAFFTTGGIDASIHTFVGAAAADSVPWGCGWVIKNVAWAWFKGFRWWYPGSGPVGKRVKVD